MNTTTTTVLSVSIDFAAACQHHQKVAALWGSQVDAALTSNTMDRFEAEVHADDCRVMRDMHADLAETVQRHAADRFGHDVFERALGELDGGGTVPLFDTEGAGL